MAVETKVDNLKIHKMPLTQFEAIETPSNTELYFVEEPEPLYAKDDMVVHNTGNETVAGNKTFTGAVILNNGTATTQAITDNSNKIATTKFVQDVIESLVARIEALEAQLGE